MAGLLPGAMAAGCGRWLEQTHYPTAAAPLLPAAAARRMLAFALPDRTFRMASKKPAAWAPFPHDAKPFAYAGEALKNAWPKLHAGDGGDEGDEEEHAGGERAPAVGGHAVGGQAVSGHGGLGSGEGG